MITHFLIPIETARLVAACMAAAAPSPEFDPIQPPRGIWYGAGSQQRPLHKRGGLMSSEDSDARAVYVRNFEHQIIDLKSGFERLQKAARTAPMTSQTAFFKSVEKFRPREAKVIVRMQKLSRAKECQSPNDVWETAQVDLEQAFGDLQEAYNRVQESVADPIAQHNGDRTEPGPSLLFRNSEANVEQWENDGGRQAT